MPKRSTLAAARVDAGSPAPPTLGRLSSPVLVGRQRELELLLAAAGRPPALALVEGEAGVGKTRLVQELLARPELEETGCYLGRSYQLGEPFPLAPVLEALRNARPAADALSPVAGALRPLLPELASLLPAPPDPLGDRRAERHRLFRAVRDLLAALGKAVLVLEDLHWADAATVQLLRFLVPQLPDELTVVCTYRKEGLPDGPLLGLSSSLPSEIGNAYVSVDPLDKSRVRELVGTILGIDEVSNEFADYLFDSSGGIPFAVEEVLLLLKDRDDLIERSGFWVRRDLEQVGVPRPLADSILERLGRLSSHAQRVVQAAAVLRTPSAEGLLAAISNLPDDRVGDALAQAVSSALLLDLGDGKFGFRHVLARQAIEDAVPQPLRGRLHMRAARALETARPKPLAQLAYHYEAAGDLPRWVRYAEGAADRAISLEDHETAYRFLEKAVLSAPGSSAKRARLAVKLAGHAAYSQAHREAIDVVRPLLDDPDLAPGLRGELRLWLGRLLRHAGETSASHAEIVRSLEDLRERPGLAAVAMAELAMPVLPEGRAGEHLDWLERAAQTADGSTDQKARIRVSMMRAVALLHYGDPRGWDAVEAIPQPGPSAKEVKQALGACTNLADATLHLGYYVRAREFIEEGKRLTRRSGWPAPLLGLNELELDWIVGKWESVEERARSFAEAYEGWPSARGAAETILALLLLARGNVKAALQRLEPLGNDVPLEVPMLLRVSSGLARIRLAEGNGQQAAAEAGRAIEIIQAKGVWVWAAEVAPVSVEAFLAAGEHAAAAELAGRFAEGLKGCDAPAAAAALRVCRALLIEAAGDRKRASSAYRAAERRWRRLPRPYEAARAKEYAGRCLLAEDARSGEKLLVEAMDAYRTLGATWDAARTRRTLREHGLVPPHRGGRRGFGTELSPREAQVARLAGEGLKSREIAVELHLSTRTVEHYLYAAMRKLGVASRGELAERLPAKAPTAAAGS